MLSRRLYHSISKNQEKDMNVEPIGPQVDLHEHLWTKVDQSGSKRIKLDQSGSY